MPSPPDTVDAIANARDPSLGPLVIPWPAPGDLNGAASFSTFGEWRNFILALGLARSAPEDVTAKFERAQKLYLLAWLDDDLIRAGELVALTALERALMERYTEKESARRRDLVAAKAEKEGRPLSKSEEWWIGYTSFADLLKFMVERDGLTDDQIAINRRCGPGLDFVGRLTGEIRPSLTDVRNDLVHGAPTDPLASAGLLEIVRDLIDYAYRDRAANQGHTPQSLGRGEAAEASSRDREVRGTQSRSRARRRRLQHAERR